jgi:hypothetical protein
MPGRSCGSPGKTGWRDIDPFWPYGMGHSCGLLSLRRARAKDYILLKNDHYLYMTSSFGLDVANGSFV